MDGVRKNECQNVVTTLINTTNLQHEDLSSKSPCFVVQKACIYGGITRFLNLLFTIRVSASERTHGMRPFPTLMTAVPVSLISVIKDYILAMSSSLFPERLTPANVDISFSWAHVM